MANEEFRDELNRAFDDVSGTPSPGLSDRVRSAVLNAPEAPAPYWMAAVAAAVIAALIVGVLWINNPLKRNASPVGIASPSPTATATTTATPTPASQLPPFACAEQDFVFKQTTPPQPTPAVAFVSALRTGTHGTYDRITIEFANGVPHDVQVHAPGSTSFIASPSGLQITVKGQHGILVVIHGADLHTSYSGSIDIGTGYATLAEVRRVEDFEGVLQLGLGVNGTGCYRAFWLNSPDRLVIDVQAGG